MLSSEQIRDIIVQAMPDAKVSVQDLTGGQDHYKVEIISTAFEGLNGLKRHRLVYAPFKTWLDEGTLHAFTLTTLTPAEKGEAS